MLREDKLRALHSLKPVSLRGKSQNQAGDERIKPHFDDSGRQEGGIAPPFLSAYAPRGQRCLILGILVFSMAVVGLVFTHYRYNFHEVRPGQLYRCGQLPNEEWESILKQYGIRTVINLRGERVERDWFQAEKQAARRCGVVHLNLPLNRHNLPQFADMQRLAHWHRTLPRPVLIHCQAGADRTSMVVVIWLLLEDDASLAEVRAQTGWWFGQLPWRQGARQLHRLLDSYQGWLDQNRLQHNSAHFHAWLGQHYDILVQQGAYRPEPLPIILPVQD